MLENIDPGSGQGWSRKFSSRRDATGALSSPRRRDLDLISGAKWPAEGRPRAPPHPQKKSSDDIARKGAGQNVCGEVATNIYHFLYKIYFCRLINKLCTFSLFGFACLFGFGLVAPFRHLLLPVQGSVPRGGLLQVPECYGADVVPAGPRPAQFEPVEVRQLGPLKHTQSTPVHTLDPPTKQNNQSVNRSASLHVSRQFLS